jgi:organic hydroperoxide reductase OsmC/OhrA
MLGTINGALAVREIRLEGDDIRAAATGTNELKDGIITLTRIDVHYSLRVPAGARETVERALARHRDKCPTARSLMGSVAVEWTADIIET